MSFLSLIEGKCYITGNVIEMKKEVTNTRMLYKTHILIGYMIRIAVRSSK